MSDFEQGRNPNQQLLPFVGVSVIDAFHQDLILMAEAEDFEGFVRGNIRILNGEGQDEPGENPGIAIVLGKLAEVMVDADDLSPQTKVVLGGIIVYRLLRNQAEAERMDAMPVQEELEIAAEPANQEEAEAAKEAAAIARSLSIDLLTENGMTIPDGVDEITVKLVRKIHDPNSIYSTDTYPDSHEVSITVKGVDPAKTEEQRPLKFDVDTKGLGGVSGWIAEDGTSEVKPWRSVHYDVHMLRDALSEFNDLPGQPSIDVSMQLRPAENVTDSRITREVFPGY